jgi:hypothetical protein
MLGYLGVASWPARAQASACTRARVSIFWSKFSNLKKIFISKLIFIIFQKELFSNFPAKRYERGLFGGDWGGYLGDIWGDIW